MYDYLIVGAGPFGAAFARRATDAGKRVLVLERDDRIGTRDSKGCIRLHNADLLKVLPYVGKGTKVRVIPGPEDLKVDADLL